MPVKECDKLFFFSLNLIAAGGEALGRVVEQWGGVRETTPHSTPLVMLT